MTFQDLSSPLTINGTTYTLADSVAMLASAILANPSGAFALVESYDASQDGTYSDCPINTTLNGTLQGLGNTISNLSIDVPDKYVFAAFIGDVGSTGAVDNLRLDKIRYAVHAATSAGGLAEGNGGYLFGDEVTGSIKSTYYCGRYHCKPTYAGGRLVGNSGTIISSSASLRINWDSEAGVAGGLVARRRVFTLLKSCRRR